MAKMNTNNPMRPSTIQPPNVGDVDSRFGNLKSSPLSKAAAVAKPSPAISAPLFQRVDTPLYEDDLNLTPEFPASMMVEPHVKRTWSLLFGRSASGLRAIRSDENGRLQVSNSTAKGRIIIDQGVISIAAMATAFVDMGGDFDYFDGIALGGIVRLRPHTQGLIHTTTCYCDPGAFDSATGRFASRYQGEGNGRRMYFDEIGNIATDVYYTVYKTPEL